MNLSSSNVSTYWYMVSHSELFTMYHLYISTWLYTVPNLSFILSILIIKNSCHNVYLHFIFHIEPATICIIEYFYQVFKFWKMSIFTESCADKKQWWQIHIYVLLILCVRRNSGCLDYLQVHLVTVVLYIDSCYCTDRTSFFARCCHFPYCLLWLFAFLGYHGFRQRGCLAFCGSSSWLASVGVGCSADKTTGLLSDSLLVASWWCWQGRWTCLLWRWFTCCWLMFMWYHLTSWL